MKKLLSITLLLAPFVTRAQFDYELYQKYADKDPRELNKQVKSMTMSHKIGNEKWTKSYYMEFDVAGLPVTSYEYIPEETKKKKFKYTGDHRILAVETYSGKRLTGITEFETLPSGQVTSYTDYIHTSPNGEKEFLWKTFLEYNADETIRKKVKLEGDKRDTVEISLFDGNGNPIITRNPKRLLRTSKTIYQFNEDKTEMKEVLYESDTAIYHAIVHKYANGKEIEKLDTFTGPQPFYWKYDSKGRVIETNESFFTVQYNTYDDAGRLKSQKATILASDSDTKDLPMDMFVKYEYDFRGK